MRFPVDINERVPCWIFVAALGFALWALSGSWQESLLDRHEFRQTQTALSAYWLSKDGLRLDYETPIFGPPWSIPLEFPLYQGLMVVVSRITAMPLEASGRALSIFFFLAMLPAVLLLGRLIGLGRGVWLVGVAVLTTPLYLFYCRTVLIESCALCLAVWFLFGIGRAAKDCSLMWSGFAAVTGMLAALLKVTTFAAYLPPAVLLACWMGWTGGQRDFRRYRNIALLCVGPILLSILASQWWVRYADNLKAANPYADFLMSSQIGPWTIGPLELRATRVFWNGIVRNMADYIIALPALATLLVSAVWAGRWACMLAAVLGLLFLGGPLIFAAVYHFHDYYYCANAVLMAMGAGVLLAGAWDSPRFPAAAKFVLLIVFIGAQINGYNREFGFYHNGGIRRPPEIVTCPPSWSVFQG